MTDAVGRGQPRALRLLIVGPINSPHVQDFAREMNRRGLEVCVAGTPWAGLTPSQLGHEGIPVLSPSGRVTLWLKRLMRELRPAVVHAHWLPYAVMARLAGARPLVATAWGSDVYLASHKQRLVYRWLLRRSEAVLADSQDLLEQVLRLGAPPGRSHTFSWGVDVSRFSPPQLSREQLRGGRGLKSGPTILSVRGLDPIYNPRVITSAFELLASRHLDLQLVLKHNSAQPPDVPAMRYSDRVHVIGPQPAEALADWFRAASVCVSLASSDSSPRSVWEAMACGCPCVVSDLPWARSELRPDRDALLVPIDADAVAQAVGRVLDSPALADALGASGRAHVVARHDRDAHMQRIISLYEQLARAASER